MTRDEYNNNPNLCLNCNQPILCDNNHKPSEIKRKKFCNKSCAASYNNKQRQKKSYFCQSCGILIGQGYDQFSRRKYCDKCNPNKKDWKEITYKDIKEKRVYQANSRIRDLARSQYLKTHLNPCCEICGYNKHIEIHHIKSISSFSDDATIAEINDEKNLIGLCPNHHWEIENGFLNI